MSPVLSFVHHARALRSKAPHFADSNNFPIIVTGLDIEVTPALLEFATKKVDRAIKKHHEFVTKCEVNLKVIHNPAAKNGHIATATLGVKGGVIRDTCATDNMYASLDGLVDKISRKLREFKERRRSQNHDSHGVSGMKVSLDASSDDDDADEPETMASAEGGHADEAAANVPSFSFNIVKTKSFHMAAISPDEAALCLSYLDHPFYVFRNKDTGEVNVLYKRGGGGLGLIEPA
jgi:putative sigma-54 modulation protein